VDELSVVLKARELINKVSPTIIPVPIEAYVEHVGAVLRPRQDLEPNEPGWCFESNGKHYICVNAKDREERQRFTASMSWRISCLDFRPSTRNCRGGVMPRDHRMKSFVMSSLRNFFFPISSLSRLRKK
jgi:hypothetical protein